MAIYHTKTLRKVYHGETVTYTPLGRDEPGEPLMALYSWGPNHKGAGLVLQRRIGGPRIHAVASECGCFHSSWEPTSDGYFNTNLQWWYDRGLLAALEADKPECPFENLEAPEALAWLAGSGAK